MQAEELLRTGDLDQALAVLTEQVRRNPSKAELRIFMFQLLSVLGQWQRAMTQLNVAADLNSDALLMASVYRSALNCEVLRAQVFEGRRLPLIFGEPPDWIGWLTQVSGLIAAGNPQAASELRDRAFEAAPAVAGRIDDQAFDWIADADPRLGPTLEAIVDGKYYWIPFNYIKMIRIEKPSNLRDVVWTRAAFTWSNAGEAVGLIPSRYPGSESVADGSLRMGRKTDWQDMGGGFFTGIGQRMLTTDQGEFPLLDIREILLEPNDVSSAASVTHG